MPTVVIVPGVGGNQLWTAAGVIPPFVSSHLWLSYVRIPAGQWIWLELAPDGVTKARTLDPSIVPGGPLTEFYSDITRYFGQRGWRVVFPELDWRSFDRDDGYRLAKTIERESISGRVAVIAHSRGGNVTRQALDILGGEAASQRVSAVVGLGVPHQGSMTAAALAAGWAPSKVTLYTVLGYFSPISPGGSPLPRLNSMINNWPSTYELFPSPSSAWLPPENLTSLYDPDWWLGQGVVVNRRHLAGAKATWLTLPKPPASVPWYDVIGYGYGTPFALSAEKVTLPNSFYTTTDGDGAVTVQSARNPTGGYTIRVPLDHQSMASSGLSLYWVNQALTSGLSGNVVVPPQGG